MNKLESISRKLFRNMPLIFGVTILAMDLIAISAPILAHFGFTQIAHWIYFVYQFLCHQRPWRSLHLFDYQVAWCSRDTFIYLSMALSAFFVVKFRIRKVKWYLAVLSLIPFALDGIVQMIAEIDGVLGDKEIYFYASTNFIRILTGSVFGAGAGLWLFSMLNETVEEELKTQNSKLKITIKNSKLWNLGYFLLIILICFVFYVGLVRVWDITSDKYKPGGLLDNVRYFPGVNYEETERGGHGI